MNQLVRAGCSGSGIYFYFYQIYIYIFDDRLCMYYYCFILFLVLFWILFSIVRRWPFVGGRIALNRPDDADKTAEFTFRTCKYSGRTESPSRFGNTTQCRVMRYGHIGFVVYLVIHACIYNTYILYKSILLE